MNVGKKSVFPYASKMAVSLALSALCLIPSAVAVNKPSLSPAARCLAQGKDCLKKGDYKKAILSFESAVSEAPDSCEAHFLLGEALCKVKAFARAKGQYRAAIRVGKGSVNAQKANKALMSLPKNVIKPRTGPETRVLISMLGISRTRGADGVAKPTIIDFYASWCHPCKQLNTVLEKVKQEYGEQISFMRVDVDDPNNERLIDQYEVSPIPTLVFLNPEGEVVTFTIGYSGEAGVTEGIKKILVKS